MNYAQLLFPDFSLILCGYLVCKYTALNRTVWNQVELLVYFFLFPVLLFYSIARTHLDLQAASHLIMAGLILAFCSIVMSYALPKVPILRRHIDLHRHAASAQVAFRFNSFIALALAERIAGPQALLLIAVLIGISVPLFNIAAVWPMARRGQRGFVQELIRNPLILATSSGLLVNFLGLHIPNWAEPTLQRIGAASLALGLMAAGAGMQLSQIMRAKVLTAAVLIIRHLITPILAFGLAFAFDLDSTQKSVLLAFSALPTASSCYVLAARMGYDGPFVAGLVTLSTVLGMLSLPFALGVLR